MYVPIMTKKTPMTLAIQCTDARVVQARHGGQLGLRHISCELGTGERTEQEETGGNTESDPEGRKEALFRLAEARDFDSGFDGPVVVRTVAWHGEPQSHDDGEKRQVGSAKVEAVNGCVDEREAFEE